MEDAAEHISEASEGEPRRVPIAAVFSMVGPVAGLASLAIVACVWALLKGESAWDFQAPGSAGEFFGEIAGSLFGLFLLLSLTFMLGLIPACLTGLAAGVLSKIVTQPAIYVCLCVVIGALVALVCFLPMGSEWSQMGAVAGAGGGLASGYLTRHRGRRTEAKAPRPAKS